ncbi:hypothetical protein CYFUS_005621 [Cystobacter fuscus]|uniref:Lipoprotein n=1 Tax=Cystobacter fuscus TaxID=43 RepID=A0A250J9B0_9BACT|nr:hypothetical protein [Cystobacter fuscus]ATB40173.1 hypothetical protein CYFUS_005621 [Cystobacter fuscus]
MRKLMAAVMVVSGLGLVTGCERKGEVQRQQENVAEAQREVVEEQREANQDIAATAQDKQEDVAEARQDLAEEQNKLAEKQYEQLSDQDTATGGSGVVSDKQAKLEEVKGTIQSTSGNNLTLIVPDKHNQLMRFKSDPQVKVMHDDKALSLSSLKAGDEVRASYQLDPNGQMLLRSVEVTKTSAKSLPDMPDMAK